MGNRFAGGIEPGAMPWLHRRIGNPVLSGIGRLFFRTPVRDFHCGIRAFRKDAIVELGLRAGGMEFASEMIVKASLAELQHQRGAHHAAPRRPLACAAPAQLPRRLAPPAVPAACSARTGCSSCPASSLFAIGAVGTAVLTFGHIGGLDIAGLLYAAALTIIGYQALWFGLLMQTYAESRGILPEGRRMRRVRRTLTLERGLILGRGAVVDRRARRGRSRCCAGGRPTSAPLNPAQNVRVITPAILGLVLGSQTILGSFSIGVLGIRTAAPDDPPPPTSATPVRSGS